MITDSSLADKHYHLQLNLEAEGYPIETKKNAIVSEPRKGDRMLNNRLTQAERAYCDFIVEYLANNYSPYVPWDSKNNTILADKLPWLKDLDKNLVDEQSDRFKIGELYDDILASYRKEYEINLWYTVLRYFRLLPLQKFCSRPNWYTVKDILKYKLYGRQA